MRRSIGTALVLAFLGAGCGDDGSGGSGGAGSAGGTGGESPTIGVGENCLSDDRPCEEGSVCSHGCNDFDEEVGTGVCVALAGDAYGCGPVQCVIAEEVCVEQATASSCGATYRCEPLPPDCADCTCLEAEFCSSPLSCGFDENGEARIECEG